MVARKRGVVRFEVKDAIMLDFGIHKWTNKKKADTAKIDTNADKSMLGLTKRLIEHSGEIRQIERFMRGKVKKWIRRNSVPAFYFEGCYLVSLSQVGVFEQFLQDNAKKLEAMLDQFLAIYPQKIKEAEKKLKPGGLFNASDYPSVAELREKYALSWQWIEVATPTTLPKEIFETERAKAEKKWATAAEAITMTLRAAFKKVVDHAANMLEPDTDGKAKAFKDATFDNITAFIDSFKYRNVTNDVELETLVNKAERLMKDIDAPQEIKSDDGLRKKMEQGFEDIQKKLSKMVITKPKRRFTFDDGDDE